MTSQTTLMTHDTAVIEQLSTHGTAITELSTHCTIMELSRHETAVKEQLLHYCHGTVKAWNTEHGTQCFNRCQSTEQLLRYDTQAELYLLTASNIHKFAK